MIASDSITIFGIRHHGPGSARSLLDGLKKLQPDCILVEGPPEGNQSLVHVIHEEMKPPVSLLVYAQDDMRNAVYYPFAIFSPEWQAIKYGLANSLPVRFMDLPQAHWLAMSMSRKEQMLAKIIPANKPEETSNGESADENIDGDEAQQVDTHGDLEKEKSPAGVSNIRRDPLSYLAKAAGYDDSERWWENLVEHRREGLDIFKAINEAMTVLRTELTQEELPQDEMEPLREAYMRQSIRAAVKEGFKNIAVVCGAWHGPALNINKPAKEDQALLKGLPRVKVESTWIPWTHERLAASSGYGAGVESPGWYHHIWTSENLIVERWLAHVAQLLRAEDLDASSAHIIEAVRLSEALASMRGQPLPGLREINEAVQAVLCFGNSVPIDLIFRKLVIGELMGEVPANLPGTPLQKDLEQQQKRLRFPAQTAEKTYDLDLRNANDLARSHLLHQLEVLGISWGVQQLVSGKSGTFHEIWKVRWMPEYTLLLIEASAWGKSVREAANAFACDASNKEKTLALLCKLLDKVLLADIQEAVDHVMQRVENEAALAVDIKHLMAALPSLVQVARYGNVRKTNIKSVEKIIDGLISRICVGLASACSSIDKEASEEIFELMLQVHSSIALLQNDQHLLEWTEALLKIVESKNMSGLISGRATRLLFDKNVFDSDEAARRFGLALSTASEPGMAADWADGFLRGSGVLLIHDQQLFDVVDSWVRQLHEDSFVAILPLLRRTFSTFTPPERRQLGERVARNPSGRKQARSAAAAFDNLDRTRAEKVIPVVLKLLGIYTDDTHTADTIPLVGARLACPQIGSSNSPTPFDLNSNSETEI